MICTSHLYALLNASSPPPPALNTESVVVGMTLTCVILLVLMTLTAAGYHFVYKSVAVKNGLPVVIILHARKDLRYVLNQHFNRRSPPPRARASTLIFNMNLNLNIYVQERSV